ncbi:SpoIIE family protein phosphatase [Streptomyces sp. KR80]|uniref:SpoIIE family protein phosphatase n=1 Tax=Streptomyces sp. KR80 TaxID=3457426 RepID=UPI003FD6620E
MSPGWADALSAWNVAEGVDFRGPLDVTRAATAVLDARDVIIGWSPAAQELLGYPPQEIIGQRVDVLLVGRPTPEPLMLGDVVAPMGRSEARIARHQAGHVVQVVTTTCPLAHGGEGPARILLVTELEELRVWEAHQAMLHGLATQSPVWLAIYDTDLRLAWANAASEREVGLGLADYVGKRADELYPGGEFLTEGYPRTLNEVMRYVLATGEPVVDVHFRARPPTDPDVDHVWSCSYYRLQDARGHTLGLCEDAFDITDRYRAQQRLALLVRAGGSIGTTLDMATTAQEVTDVVVPRFADSVMVDLMETVLDGEEPHPGAGPAQPLVRLAEASSLPVVEGETDESAVQRKPQAPRRVSYAPDSPQSRCLSSDSALLVGGTRESRVPGEPGVHSCLVVPLRARGVTMGLVTLLRGETPDPFDRDELSLADELVARTAVCMDNARRYTRERTAALTLQRNLLPRHVPQQSAVDVAYRYLPTDHVVGVGGDWFDVIPLSGTRVGLVVGDVVGHGLHAAATMGRLRTTVRALARLDLAPDELLSRLDDLVGQGAEEREEAGRPEIGGVGGGSEDDPALGVTCLYIVYDPVSRRCTMARAGHLPPVVVDAEGRRSLPDLPVGPPLGLGGLPFESLDVTLPDGSLIALFTNGLVGTHDQDIEAALDMLGDVLTDHRDSLEELCDRALAELLPRGPATDDAALLLVRTRELGAEQVAVWELPTDPASAGEARTLATSQLTAWGLEELAFSTELVVSELVTNAIRHAAGPVHLRLIRDRTLLCEVSDGGHTSPHLRYSASDDEGGRGLFIVAQMVQRWGTRYMPSGKTIWTEQAFPNRAARLPGAAA